LHLHDDPSFDIISKRDSAAPGGRIAYAVIHCRSCPASAEVSIRDKSAGWARRIFKTRGWSVADRKGRHQCPTCAQGPRGLGGKSAREEMRNGTALSRQGSLKVDGPLPPIDPDILHKPELLADALSHLGRVTPHKEEPPPVAHKSDSTFKGAASPIALPLSPRPLGLPLGLYPAKRRPGFRLQARKTQPFRYPSDAAVTAREYCKANGIADPKIGVDFILWAEGATAGWAPTTSPETWVAGTPHYRPAIRNETFPPPVAPEPPPSPEPVIVTPEEPMTSAAPPARPTRADIRAIQDALDLAYNVEAQRYVGEATDASVAEGLNLPRAWVTEERERAYGPEVNEAASAAADKWRRNLTNRAAKLGEDILSLAGKLEALALEAEGIKNVLSAGPVG